ncbi:MAG: RNA pseudouridine synthase [Gammaproteobacteria bacterium]|nr:RNA pseudouridine synthase [Gammaproteobacteria bacterium]NNJ49600.1 RNA pseudouridine synthase [Gammaproteobacteria bacterium]
MTKGAVWLESSSGIQRLRRAKKQLAENDTVHLYYDAAIQDTAPAAAELIDDQGDYSIWNKPYGMYSQGTRWGDHCTISRWAEQHLKPQRPAFPVHRLDRAASGLMILAHTKKMAQVFSGMFKKRKIQKQYRATVIGRLDDIDLPFSIESTIDDKPAMSKILSLQQQDNNTTVVIEIETGRKHQIRRHLSAMGFPIVGDRLYGSDAPEDDLKLQAIYLKFNCPITDQVREYKLNNNDK